MSMDKEKGKTEDDERNKNLSAVVKTAFEILALCTSHGHFRRRWTYHELYTLCLAYNQELGEQFFQLWRRVYENGYRQYGKPNRPGGISISIICSADGTVHKRVFRKKIVSSADNKFYALRRTCLAMPHIESINDARNHVHQSMARVAARVGMPFSRQQGWWKLYDYCMSKAPVCAVDLCEVATVALYYYPQLDISNFVLNPQRTRATLSKA